jgi:hypothetical protein
MEPREKTKSYTLEFEEKATPIMVYTLHYMTRGEVISKEMVRVSTWLRTPTAPPYICLYDSQVLFASGSALTLPYKELHIPANEVLAYHMIPPQQDPLDYDEKEPNRKMEAVSALVGPYRFDGHLRMAVTSSIRKYLEVMSEKYTSFYDVIISQPQRPNMKALHVPFLLLRREYALFLIQT